MKHNKSLPKYSPELNKMRSELEKFRVYREKVDKIVTSKLGNQNVNKTIFNITEIKQQILKNVNRYERKQREHAKSKVLGPKKIKSDYSSVNKPSEQYLKFLIGPTKDSLSSDFTKSLKDKINQINLRSLSSEIRRTSVTNIPKKKIFLAKTKIPETSCIVEPPCRPKRQIFRSRSTLEERQMEAYQRYKKLVDDLKRDKER